MDKKSIQELKSLASPPPMVLQVSNIVCLLLGEKQDWPTAKKLMSNPQTLKDRMENFDPSTMTKATKTKLNQALADPELTIENVMKKSSAAASFMNWVLAVHAALQG